MAAKLGAPGNPAIRYHLGMAYLTLERTAEARAELQKALALSKIFPGREDAAKALDSLSKEP